MRVLHVVESNAQSAGSVCICLHGLIGAVRTRGVDSGIVDGAREYDSQLATADLIHLHGWNYPLAIRCASSTRKAGKTLVLSPLGRLTPGPHNQPAWFTRLRRRFSEGPLIRTAKQIMAVNEAEARMLRETCSHRDLCVLPIGIHFDEYSAISRHEQAASNPLNLLMLGPLDPVSGCVMLLKSIAELGQAADGWTVTLAGPDPQNMRSKLEAAVRRKGGEARVIFRDARTIEEQKKLLAEADLLADLSLQVSPGVSIMQALAAGVPVVATRDAVPAGMDGSVRVCGPRREDVREALRDLLTMPVERRREWGLSAREKAKGLLHWPVLAPRYAKMYESCLRS